jgi:Flp pilus assembly protein TadG
MDFLKRYMKTSKGVAAIEFAFILPVYLLFIFGIIELGYVLWGFSALEYGASYGARYAFVHPTSSSSTIQNYALSKIDFPNNAITYTVTMSGSSAVINGSFSYTFLVLPLNPITITTQMTQSLPTS